MTQGVCSADSLLTISVNASPTIKVDGYTSKAELAWSERGWKSTYDNYPNFGGEYVDSHNIYANEMDYERLVSLYLILFAGETLTL